MLQTLKSWFKPQPATPPRRLYDPYVDKVIEQAWQGATMLGEAFQYDWDGMRFYDMLRHPIVEQPLPQDSSLHVPYAIAQESLQHIICNELNPHSSQIKYSYWTILDIILTDKLSRE